MGMIFRNLRRISLTSWIIIAMVVGVIVGWAFPTFAVSLKPLSTIFLRMIKSIIVPIIFGTLVVGIAGHGDDMKRVGRLALKSIIYFEIVTTIALFIGLGAANLIKPGVGVTIHASADPGQQLAQATPTGMGFLEHVVPQSFFGRQARTKFCRSSSSRSFLQSRCRRFGDDRRRSFSPAAKVWQR